MESKKIVAIIAVHLSEAFTRIAQDLNAVKPVKEEKTIEDERESKKETTSVKEEKTEEKKETPKDEKKNSLKNISMDELRALSTKVAKKSGPGVVFEILESCGANKIVNLEFGQYDKAAEMLKGCLEK